MNRTVSELHNIYVVYGITTIVRRTIDNNRFDHNQDKIRVLLETAITSLNTQDCRTDGWSAIRVNINGSSLLWTNTPPHTKTDGMQAIRQRWLSPGNFAAHHIYRWHYSDDDATSNSFEFSLIAMAINIVIKSCVYIIKTLIKPTKRFAICKAHLLFCGALLCKMQRRS